MVSSSGLTCRCSITITADSRAGPAQLSFDVAATGKSVNNYDASLSLRQENDARPSASWEQDVTWEIARERSAASFCSQSCEETCGLILIPRRNQSSPELGQVLVQPLASSANLHRTDRTAQLTALLLLRAHSRVVGLTMV